MLLALNKPNFPAVLFRRFRDAQTRVQLIGLRFALGPAHQRGLLLSEALRYSILTASLMDGLCIARLVASGQEM